MDVGEKYGIDLYREHKTACPRCRSQGRDKSGDNLMVYGKEKDGTHKGAFCWSCEFTILSEHERAKRGIDEVEEKEEEIVGTAFNAEIHARLKEETTTDPRGFRGLKRETTSWFGVLHELDPETGQVAKQYYPTTYEYELSGYKIRRVPKDFSQPPLGETGKECDMFGQFRFRKSNANRVLIVGGEVDQLSAFQMLKEGYTDPKGYEAYPVVSSTVGEAGTHKQVAKQYKWFDRFQQIIICMDNDEAGRAAVEKLAMALPKGKVYVMNMTFKDPNEYLVAGQQQAFINAFFRAQPWTPNGIVGSGQLLQMMREAVLVEKIPLPPFMHKAQDMMAGGIPLGRIVNLGSASGTGKSTIVDECVYYWIYNSPHKIGVVSLESDCAEYGIKLASRHIGRKIDLIQTVEEKVALLNDPDVSAAIESMIVDENGQHRFHLLDERDGGLDDLKNKIMELIVSCGCKVIILDPLQDILDGMSNEEQAVFMRWQKGMTKSHKVTFININHVRKSGQGGKQNSAGAELFEEDFQGSSAIFKSGACNLLFTRNKEAECDVERNVTYMKMTKCRWTGNTGKDAGRYYYDNRTHTIHDLDDYLKKNPAAAQAYAISQAAKEED